MEIENSGGGWWSVERYTRLKICTVEGHEDDHGRKKKKSSFGGKICVEHVRYKMTVTGLTIGLV